MTIEPTQETIRRVLASLGIDPSVLEGGDLEASSPIDGAVIGSIATTGA